MKHRLYPRVTGSEESLALLFMRLAVGSAFMLHGWSKIQDPLHWMGPESRMPPVLQTMAAISEFFGGAAWLVGFLTPLAGLGIACTMAVAVWSHYIHGDPFVGKGGRSFELALVYLTVAIVMILVGPGRYSLDARLFKGQRRL